MTSTVSDTSSPDTNPMLDAAVQAHLGTQLRVLYGDPVEIKMPRRLAQLADRVAQVIRAHTEPVDQAFVDGMASQRQYAR
jgi:RNA polymerase sigma-70 factor, ECF subfamily